MKKFLFLLAVVLFGCASSSVTMFRTEEFPPTTKVQVFTDLATLTEPYTEIGYVEAKGGALASKQQCLNSMIEKAKAVGADALIKIDFGDQQQYTTSGAYQTPIAKAVMVRFKSHK